MVNKNDFDINVFVEISYQSQYAQIHFDWMTYKSNLQNLFQGKTEGIGRKKEMNYNECLYEKQSVKQVHIHLLD
jgi:hypothetical protein